ncbi:MAG: 50S rRNA methyltransferase [Deltaproteobacteria bacterium RIFCSPHIGHO2_02_FULL_40_11]|nr:MAG: 50S rRNA methyltransferase [Deltaproteobacteria bacterium RIFCSPHIGHO2_02_FULL_40_11]
MSYKVKDHYFHKAKAQNYAARSVFKLEEIDQKYRLLKSGHHVLDLGAAPGSWSQYASKKIGSLGKVLAIDLKPVSLNLPNVVFLEGDVNDLGLDAILSQYHFNPKFDHVLSDMAPKTTGIRFADQAASLELCELALGIAVQYLKPGGNFVCKFFQSQDFQTFRQEVKKYFSKNYVCVPKSTRKESKEVFFVALDFLGH